MEITREFLQAEIAKWERQRNHAHEVAVASQAAVDTLTALITRMDTPEESAVLKLSDLGLPDPVPNV